MDTKLTLSFNKEVIEKAKKFAAKHNISLSRLIEHLLTRATEKPYKSLEDFPVESWVNMVAEPEVEYKLNKTSRKAMKKEYFSSKK